MFKHSVTDSTTLETSQKSLPINHLLRWFIIGFRLRKVKCKRKATIKRFTDTKLQLLNGVVEGGAFWPSRSSDKTPPSAQSVSSLRGMYKCSYNKARF